MMLNFRYQSQLWISLITSFTLKTLQLTIPTGCLPICMSLYPSKTELFIFGLPQQLSKLNNPTIHLPNNVILSPVNSAHNLGVIFDKNLSFAQHNLCNFKIMLSKYS